MSYYEIVSNQSGAKREDWPLKSTVSDADASQGMWVEQDSNGEAVQANDGVFTATTHQRGRCRPILSGKEAPDAQELDQVTTVYGPHEALTDGFWADPTALSTARAAWAKEQAVVVVDGKLAPFLDATDKDYAAVGYVKELEDSNGYMRFHIW